MARYQDDDSDSSRTLLLAAGVLTGLLAGAVVAHRYGGLKGIRRMLRRKRSPLLAALRSALPSGLLSTLIDAVGIDDIVRALAGGTRRRSAARRRRRLDPDLDEYEVDDVDRVAAGYDDDDDDRDAEPRSREALASERRGRDANGEQEDDEDLDGDTEEDVEDDTDDIVEPLTPEAIEDEVLAAFRQHPVLRQRALEIAVDEDGVAELTGWVRREREVRIARRVAARVPGVERVVVDVAVRDAVRPVADADDDTDVESDTESSRT